MRIKVKNIYLIVCLITVVFFCILACDNGSAPDSASSKTSSLVKVSLAVDGGSSGIQKAISINDVSFIYMYKAVPTWKQQASRPIAGDTNNQFVLIPGYDPSTPTPLGYFTPGQWVFYIQVLNGSTPVYEGHSDVSISSSQSNITVSVDKIQGITPGVVNIEVTAPTINNTDILTIEWKGTANGTGAAIQGSDTVTATPSGSISTFSYTKQDLPIGIYTFTLNHNNVNDRGGSIAVDIRQGEMALISGCLDNGEWQLGRLSYQFHNVDIVVHNYGTQQEPEYYGTVDWDVDYAVSGDKVSICTRPEVKSSVSVLTVTCNSTGQEIEYTRVGELYTFNMPDDAVTVRVAFTKADPGIVDVLLFRVVVQALYSQHHNDSLLPFLYFGKANNEPGQLDHPTRLGNVDIWYDGVNKICWYPYSGGNMTLSPGSLAGLFFGCDKFLSIDMNDIIATDINDMSDMFQGCTALTAVTLPNIISPAVSNNMAGMFQGCTSLRTLSNLNNFDSSKVTSFASMFQGCTSLTALDLSDFDASSATDMSGMFQGCTSLATLSNLNNFDSSKVTSFASMFQGCTSLTALDLSDFDASSATDLSDMFRDCINLVTLDLDGFTLNTANNEFVDINGLFRACVKLKGKNYELDKYKLDLSSFNTSRVKDMSYLFCGCKALTTITVSANFTTEFVEDMSYMFSSVDEGKAESASNKMNLTNLDFVGQFDTTNVTDMSHMFYMCSDQRLKSIPVSNFNTSKVTDMSYMFGCWDGSPSFVEAFDLSGWDFSQVTTVNRMFDRCESAEITFPGQTMLTHIGDILYWFSHCFQMDHTDLGNIIKSWDFTGYVGPKGQSTIDDLQTFFANIATTDSEKSPNNRLMKNDMTPSYGDCDFDVRYKFKTHDNNAVIQYLYVGGNPLDVQHQRLTTDPLGYTP